MPVLTMPAPPYVDTVPTSGENTEFPLIPETYDPPTNGFAAIDTCFVIAGAYAEDTTGLEMYEDDTAGAYEPA